VRIGKNEAESLPGDVRSEGAGNEFWGNGVKGWTLGDNGEHEEYAERIYCSAMELLHDVSREDAKLRKIGPEVEMVTEEGMLGSLFRIVR
jgi:hypothetical protein